VIRQRWDLVISVEWCRTLSTAQSTYLPTGCHYSPPLFFPSQSPQLKALCPIFVSVPFSRPMSPFLCSLHRAPPKRVPRNEAAGLSRPNDPPDRETKHPDRSRGAWRS
jgi:hypothetical protein